MEITDTQNNIYGESRLIHLFVRYILSGVMNANLILSFKAVWDLLILYLIKLLWLDELIRFLNTATTSTFARSRNLFLNFRRYASRLLCMNYS